MNPQVFKNFNSGSLKNTKNFCQLAFERKYSLVVEYFFEQYLITVIGLVCLKFRIYLYPIAAIFFNYGLYIISLEITFL